MAFIKVSPSLTGKGAQSLSVTASRGLRRIPMVDMSATVLFWEHRQAVCRCLSNLARSNGEVSCIIDRGPAGGLRGRQSPPVIRRTVVDGVPDTGTLLTNLVLAGVV